MSPTENHIASKVQRLLDVGGRLPHPMNALFAEMYIDGDSDEVVRTRHGLTQEEFGQKRSTMLRTLMKSMQPTAAAG